MADPFPDSFWAQSSQVLDDPNFQLIYAEIAKKLRDENPNADTLETIQIERIAFLYTHIRMKETKKLFANDRAYKETMATWHAMVESLRRYRERRETFEKLRDDLKASLNEAIMAAIPTMPDEHREAFLGDLADRLEEMHL